MSLLNKLIKQLRGSTANKTELAYRVAKSASNPESNIGLEFLGLAFSFYETFRYLALAGFKANPENGVATSYYNTYYDITKKDIDTLNAEKLRNYIHLRTGDGKTSIKTYFTYVFNTLEADVCSDFAKAFKMGAKIPLADAYETASQLMATMTGVGPGAKLQEPYKTFTETLKKYTKIVKPYLIFDIEHGEDNYSDLVITAVLELDVKVYKYVADSDEFSPYVMHLALMNMLSASSNRSAIVVDPRKTSAIAKYVTSKYGNAKPRVNAEGYAMFGSGQPIYLPTSFDTTTQLVRAGDTCIDENGDYDANMLVDKHKLANQLVYVDWLNDIVAFTTATGILDTISLIGTMNLTPSMEFAYLNTDIKDRDFIPYFNTLNNSFADFDSKSVYASVVAALPDAYKTKFLGGSATDVYLRLTRNYVAGSRKDSKYSSGITLANLCGFDLEGLEVEQTIVDCLAYKAMIQLLLKQRSGTGDDVLKVPQKYVPQGIRFRLIGLEYIAQAIAWKTPARIAELAKAHKDEVLKSHTSRKDDFAIPNIDTSESGLHGLLPHQVRILSSMEKTPAIAVLPVSTGGGKTLLAIVDAIMAMKNVPNIRPLIATKGNLVKDMVTEINKMTQGKINAVPLRASTLRRLKATGGIDTFDKLFKWYRSLPANTIFICSYSDFATRAKIYDELPTVSGFGAKAIPESQFRIIIRLFGINMIIADESHLIKKPKSKRSQGAYSAMGAADYRRVMSGTVINNTVADVVGQMTGISPAIFGNDVDVFLDKYDIPKIIRDDETAAFLKQRIKQFSALHFATRDEWAYMLPNKDDTFEFVSLTPNQQAFYDKLMLDAYLLLTGKKKLTDAEKAELEEASETELTNSDEESDADADDDEAEEEAFLAKAKVYFSKVEQFIAAPDENDQYIAQVDVRLSKEDMISPKVIRADQLIDAHLNKYAKELATNKLIVFAINKSAVRHFARHSKHAPSLLVYQAGDNEVLRQFETDARKPLLLAAETSVREGKNWQFVSKILRLQSPWAPGDYEQATARMFRPDPRGVYNRDSVSQISLLIEQSNNQPSLDGAKMARLVSKYVSNGRMVYEDNPKWKRISKNFDELGLIKMNLKLIFETKNEDLKDHFASWVIFNDFENDLATETRITTARTLEASTGEKLLDANGKITDMAKLIRLVMATVSEAPPIPGSKRVFTPWIDNQLPPDPDNYGYEVLGARDIAIGTVVLTEYGPGIVRKFSRASVKIELFGGNIIGFNRSMICVVPSVEKYKRFSSIVKDAAKWKAMSQTPMSTGLALPTKELTLRKDNKIPEDVEDITPKVIKNNTKLDKPMVDVYTSIINSMPALVIQEDLPELESLGWKYVDPYAWIKFRNWSGMTALLEEIDKKTYIPDTVFDAISDEIDLIKSGRVATLTKKIDQKAIRQFFFEQKKKYGKKDGKIVVIPYLLTVERDVRIAFDIDSHDTKFIQWLQRNAKAVPGVDKFGKSDGFWCKVFRSVGDARKDLSALVGKVNFDQNDLSRELTQLRDELETLFQARRRPL